MPDLNDSPEQIFDFLEENTSADDFDNKRIAVRYIRDDITAFLFTKIWFKSIRLPVKLIDISSKGALISCPKKLALNKKIILSLRFQDGKQFDLPATIIHKKKDNAQSYGLKFEVLSNKLGDYLLSSQNDLVFK